MRNVKLKIAYDGTSYNGWQRQKNIANHSKPQKTIQHTIQKVLSKILQEDITLLASGRTDSGVHAKGQIANFKTKSDMPLRRVKRALNGLLPKDIVILSAGEADLDFHSRFQAVSKTYRYRISNRSERPIFTRLYEYHIPYKLDVERMAQAAKALKGKKDFKSFQAADKKRRGSVRTVRELSIINKGDVIDIVIKADGFLYNMVRNIAGTLIEAGKGRLSANDVAKVLRARDRRTAGPTAPAHGLCLMKVEYR